MAAIRVELELADGSFTTRMIHAGETLRQFERNVGQTYTSLRRVEEAGRGFLASFRDLTVIFAGAGAALNNLRAITTGWAGQIVQVNAEMERLRVLMQSMSTAADPIRDAADQMKMLRDFALQAPYSLRGLTDVFVKLKSTGIDPTTGSMKALVDAVASFGGNEETLKRASLAISQMSGKGVIQMEELRQQLGEAIPRATELMARAMGVSMDTLIQEISTGTVQAKPALQALQMELDRVFGGAAQRQMATFSGMMAQTSTLMQNLALKVGESQYFETVKRQLRDFNAALAGPEAQRWADSIGQALTSVVNVIRSGVNIVIRFREEIVGIGQAMAYAFVATTAVRFFASFAAAITRVRQELVLFRAQLAATNAQAAATNLGTVTSGFAAAATRLRVLTAAMPALGAAFSTLAPWLPLLGAGLYLLADRFGFLGEKTREAWQELERYKGAASKESMKTAFKDLQELRSELADLESDAHRNRVGGVFFDGMSRAERQLMLEQRIAEKRREIAEREKTFGEAANEAARTEADRQANHVMSQIQRELDAVQRKYDEEGRRQADAHREERTRLINQGKYVGDIDQAYREQRAREAVKFYDDQLKVLDEHYAQQKALAASGNEQVAAIANEALNKIARSQAQIVQMREAAEQMTMGVPKGAKPVRDEEQFQRGQQALKNIRAEVTGLQAALQGASAEVVELSELLRQGKYGPADRQEVQRLIESLIQAQKEKEKLDELLEGRSKLERDILNARIKMEEELLELQAKAEGRELDEVEKIKIRLRQDYYKGLTLDANGNVRSAIENIRRGIGGMEQASKAAEESLKNGVFGDNMLTRARSFLDIIRGLGSAWDDFRNGVNNTDPSRAMQSPGTGGYSGNVSGSYLDKVIGVESGGIATAKNPRSTATGLGQFIEGTWLQFIRETMPQILNKGVAYALTLRNDPNLSRQAVAWYADKNARYLQERNLEPTDRNLYLSHFLGPEGAVKALTSNMMTKLEALFPAKVINDNREVMAGKTVADLLAWAGRKMGDGTSWTGSRESLDRRGPQRMDYIDTGVTRELEKLTEQRKELTKQAGETALAVDLREIRKRAEEAKKEIVGMGDAEAQVRAEIEAGKYGRDRTNPDAEYYKEIIAAAKALDQAEEDNQKRRQAREKADSAIQRRAQRAEDLAEKEAAARDSFKNPLDHGRSESYLALERQLRREGDLIKQFYGQDSAQYRQHLEQKELLLQQHINSEVLQTAAGWQQKIDALRQGMMTESQARQAETERYIQQIQKELEAFRGSAEERAALEAKAQELIALARQKTAMDGPLARQMKEWSDFGGNMEQAMTGWLDSAADALANFITTGKADFKSLANAIIADITRIALKATFSNLFGGQGKGNAAKAAGAKAASGGKSFPFFHTGGIVGQISRMSGRVNPMVFANAPRFHTGGIIKGMGLKPGEVPIIAKKGEGVFTPEQMAAMGQMGGSQVITISPTVQVNATGGTKEQNADLAAQTAKAVEGTIRQIVAQELLVQRRQGGMLAR